MRRAGQVLGSEIEVIVYASMPPTVGTTIAGICTIRRIPAARTHRKGASVPSWD
jgi:hypothetical protein